MARHASVAAPRPSGLPPLQGDAHLPLYRRICQTFAGSIAGGEWKPGDALPAETEIARHYTIAPGTVRRAMEELASQGLIDRQHGRGTFVRRPNFDHAMVRFFRFRDASGGRFLPESFIISRKAVPMPPDIATRLAMRSGKAIHIVRHRKWNGLVRLIEDIFVPERPFRPMLGASAEEIGPLLYPAYERLCGQVVFAIEEEMTIVEATGEEATQLGLATGDLIVRIERLARDAAGRPLEWRISRAEARHFRYRLTGLGGTLPA